jgi:predicted nucleic-acid-binding protein
MKKPVFVDTNVFLRFFVKDDPGMFEKSRTLFARTESGEISLVTGEIIIAEVVWVLESYYGFKREEILTVLEAILGTRHLRVINRAMLQEAVRLFKEGSMDFVDACALASAGQAGCTSIATFDRRHFRKGRLPLYWE